MSIFRKKIKNNIGVFTYNGSGKYELLELPEETTEYDVLDFLNIHTDQTVSSYGDGSENIIEEFVYEIFSLKILYIKAKDGTKNLAVDSINAFNKFFDPKISFNCFIYSNKLQDGIKNKSLSFDFLIKVIELKKDDETDQYISEKWDLLLEFDGNLLSGFAYTKGQNLSAVYVKHLIPELHRFQYIYALISRDKDVDGSYKELNIQFDAFMRVPHGFSNEHLEKYRFEYMAYNFVLLMIHEYAYEISYSDFSTISYLRGEEIYNDEEGACIRWGDFYYIFGKDKMFVGFKHYIDIHK